MRREGTRYADAPREQPWQEEPPTRERGGKGEPVVPREDFWYDYDRRPRLRASPSLEDSVNAQVAADQAIAEDIARGEWFLEEERRVLERTQEPHEQYNFLQYDEGGSPVWSQPGKGAGKRGPPWPEVGDGLPLPAQALLPPPTSAPSETVGTEGAPGASFAGPPPPNGAVVLAEGSGGEVALSSGWGGRDNERVSPKPPKAPPWGWGGERGAPRRRGVPDAPALVFATETAATSSADPEALAGVSIWNKEGVRSPPVGEWFL